MGVFSRFPYSNAHQINMDWILNELKRFQEEVEKIKTLSQIKYADPLNWNITEQYEENTIVLNNDVAYLSKTAVPSGILINNTDYWTPVFDLSQLFQALKAGITVNIETSTVTTRNYTAGELVWAAQSLFRTLVDTTAGTVLTDGYNAEPIDINTCLIELLNKLNQEKQDRIDADDALRATISASIGAKLVKNVLDYGAVGDGVTNDTQAIQDCFADNTEVYFPAGYTFKVDTLNVTEQNLTLSGSGTLDGTIKVTADWPNNDPLYLQIIGMTFTAESPVIIDRGIGIRIENCRFYNSDKAINITPTGTMSASTYSHVVEEVEIVNNFFRMVNYALYSDKGTISGVALAYLYLGDITFQGNSIKVAKRSHIDLSCVDGAIISNNTMFHYGHGSQVPTKEYNIRIRDFSAGVLISDNRLFEAGLESISLFNSNGYTISNNHIIQPGQCAIRSAILINNYATADNSQTTMKNAQSIISGNIIYEPSKYGIELQNNYNVLIRDNYITNPATSSAYYGDALGQPAMSSVTHFGISSVVASGQTPGHIVGRNVCSNASIMYTGCVCADYPENHSLISGTTFSTNGGPLYFMNPSGAVTISNISANEYYDGQTIVFLAFNNRTTFATGGNIRLQGGINYTMPNNSTLTLMYMNNTWYEISRTVYS